MGIHLRGKSIARQRLKVTFADANVPKASKSVARYGLTSFNVYR